MPAIDRSLEWLQVLLKNEKQTLPLKPGGKIAVLGPHEEGHDVFLSNYHGR